MAPKQPAVVMEQVTDSAVLAAARSRPPYHIHAPAFERGGFMEITVLVETLPTQGFRATSLGPAGFVAEAPTRDEALAQLDHLVRAQFSQGEVVRLQIAVPEHPHPWHFLAGTWKDHPDAQALEQHMAEYRRQADADPDRP
jgi:hypothetical protein